MELCIHQLRRPLIYIKRKGVGNCLTCEPDEGNKNCKEYYPIKINVFEIKEKEKK